MKRVIVYIIVFMFLISFSGCKNETNTLAEPNESIEEVGLSESEIKNIVEDELKWRLRQRYGVGNEYGGYDTDITEFSYASITEDFFGNYTVNGTYILCDMFGNAKSKGNFSVVVHDTGTVTIKHY